MALVVLGLLRDFTQDRDVDELLHILTVPDLGIQRHDEDKNQERNKHADDDSHQHILNHVGRHRIGPDPRLVHDGGIALDGRLADQEFLALTEERQVQFLLDALDPGDVVNIQLPAGDGTHLVVRPLPHGLHGLQTLAQGADISGQKLVQVALEGALLQVHVLHDRVVGRTGLLVLVQLEDQFVEAGDRAADVLILDIDGEREKAVRGIGIRELHQVLRMGDLRHDAFRFLRGFDARGNVVLAVVLQVQDLVVPLEGRDLGLLGTQLGVQLRDTGVDIIRGLLDDRLFLVDGILVIHGDHLVQDVRRPLGICILKREVHNPVARGVARDRHPGPVVLRHIHDVAVADHDGLVIIEVPQRPGRTDDDPAETRAERIVQAAPEGIAFADLHGHG